MDDATFDAALAEIAADRRSGAGALARRCLEVLAASAEGEFASNGSVLRARAQRLAAARPAMAPPGNLIGRWLAALDWLDPDDPRKAAEEARRIARESDAATGRAAGNATAHLRGFLAGAARPRVLTLSWSSVVAQALAGLAGGGAEIWVAESRPLNEGARLAEVLAGKGLAVTLITDAQVAGAAKEATVGICGADALFADGTVVNKAGTALMALALTDAGRPLVAACESFKLASGDAADWRFEEMDAGELGYGEDAAFAVRNVYFEPVAPRLIDAWITENGVARAPEDLPGIL